jgi:hypothetical protein
MFIYLFIIILLNFVYTLICDKLKNKFKQIDPVDYDLYIEQNLSNLRKDICTKQLIFLPADDLNAESDDLDKDLIDNSLIRNKDISLFVNDCLNIYFNQKYEIKYKHHSYGGNYRQLPNFSEITIEKYDFSNSDMMSLLFLFDL